MSKSKYPVNEKSFFATPESVGTYWRQVKKARRRHKAIVNMGAIGKSTVPTGVVVVNPKRQNQIVSDVRQSCI